MLWGKSAKRALR